MKDKQKILNQSFLFQELFALSSQINLPHWYIAGGAVSQTVWNYQLNRESDFGIKDIDIVYFDKDSTLESDERERSRVEKVFLKLPKPIDLNNQANVHSWYQSKFGNSIEPYQSVEEGMSTWLSAFSIGIRKENDKFKIYAAQGLGDMFSMLIRPNKRQITQEIYEKMVYRLKGDWPEIRVISCDSDDNDKLETLDQNKFLK